MVIFQFSDSFYLFLQFNYWSQTALNHHEIDQYRCSSSLPHTGFFLMSVTDSIVGFLQSEESEAVVMLGHWKWWFAARWDDVWWTEPAYAANDERVGLMLTKWRTVYGGLVVFVGEMERRAAWRRRYCYVWL